MKANFHGKDFARSLAFIMRFTATRKWPIKCKIKIGCLNIRTILLANKSDLQIIACKLAFKKDRKLQRISCIFIDRFSHY